MSLYDKTVDAIAQFDVYKNPDLDDWTETIDQVLKELELPLIGNDKLDYLDIHSNQLSIRTSYSARCCICTNDMAIPLDILKAPDPVKAARKHCSSEKIKKLEYSVERLSAELKVNLEQLRQLKEELLI